MNHEQMIRFIAKNAVLEDPPSLLLIGPPGVGKTTLVTDAAREVAKKKGLRFRIYDEEEVVKEPYDPKKDYVLAYLPPEIEPVEVTGHPKDRGEAMGYKPYGWAYTFRKNGGCNGIIFADEALSARSDTIDAFMRLFLNKSSGFMRLREDVLIVAAGNSAEDNPLAKALPKHSAGRIQFLALGAPTVEALSEYVSGKDRKWDSRPLAYLWRFPDDIYERVEGNELSHSFANPRSWERLMLQLAQMRPSDEEELKSMVEGWIGPVVGQKLLAFMKYDIPRPERFLKEPALFTELKERDKEHGLDKQFLAIASVAQYVVTKETNPTKAGQTLAHFAAAVANEVAGSDLLVTLVYSLPRHLGKKDYRVEACINMANSSSKVAAAIERVLRNLPSS